MPGPYRPKGIHTANMPSAESEFRGSGLPARPFITIAQQVGAECPSLPQRLTEALNERGASTAKWSHWDQQLIETVSAASKIPAERIASLDTSAHSWVDDLLGNLAGRTDELTVFHHLKETVRGLAASGNVVLVGHGSTYMTRDLAAGLHVRLIAPMNFRLKSVAARLNLPPREAGRHMRRLYKRRKAFFARFWPGRPLAPDMFAANLNVAELDEQRLIRAIMAMLPESGGF